MPFSTGFASGADAVNRGLAIKEERLKREGEENEKDVEKSNKLIEKTLETISTQVALLKTKAETEGRTLTVEELVADPLIAEMGKGLEAHGANIAAAGGNVSPALLKAKFEQALNTQSDHEKFKIGLSQTKQTSQATAEGTALGKPEVAGKTKEVLDTKTNEIVLATDKQIAAEPGRFVPKKDKDDSKDKTSIIKTVSDLTSSMLNNNAPIDSIRGVITALGAESNDPEVTAAVTAILDNLPESQEAFQTEIAEREIAAAQPKIDALIDAGVDPELAQIIGVGGKGASVTIDASSTKLTPQELKVIRTDLSKTRQIRRRMENLLPLINNKTVGILSGISDTVGGIGQQIPGISAIFNTLGAPLNLDESSVKQVQQAKSAFKAMILPMTQFIMQNKQRLSNQQMELIRDAQGLLTARSNPENAKGIMQEFINLAIETEAELEAQLNTKSVNADEDFDLVPDPDSPGNFIVRKKGG